MFGAHLSLAGVEDDADGPWMGSFCVYCWSHVRQQFYDLAAASPIATEALSRITALYRIEAEIRGRSAEERRVARQERSRPVVEALEAWLREKLARNCPRGGLVGGSMPAAAPLAGTSLALAWSGFR